MRSLRLLVTLLFVLTCTAVSLSAQTASTSTVAGTVYDKSGAVVPKASVELTDVATNAKTRATTGDDGQFVFPAVPPGNYKLTVSVPGFRQAVFSGVKVEVGKAALVNVTLEVGQVTQVVEVQAGVVSELQTLDASVGNVLDQNILKNMPSLSRDATSLLLLQPLTTPGFNGPGGTGEFGCGGGTVAGARSDQNTFMLDGGDATSSMEGNGGYNIGFIATPRAAVPTPVESLEEFRVATNNQNVTFTRSGGAEVQMVTRRGTNAWHGSAYWYHQNDELNANDWFRNSRGQENPEWRDNRYGGRIGGPIWKDRTFFMVHEEERHFSTPNVFTRLVPTNALRAGILKFPDGTGVVRAYNLNPVPTLDPKASTTDNDPQIGTMLPPSGLDPRGIGINPAIAAEWNTLPLPNDFTGGDKLRSANFTSTSPETINEHFAVLRLDHKISNKWDFMASYRYSVTENIPPLRQVDIGGITPGSAKGVPCSTASRPLQPRYLVAGLTTRLTPNVTNEFHFDWLRHWWEWKAPGSHTAIIPTALSDSVLQIWNESRVNGMVPINVDTQNGRERSWNGRDFTWIDNLSWAKGKHLWQFGGRAQVQHLFHNRNDKVVGGLTSPIYYVARSSDFNHIAVSAFRPPVCPSNSSGTNCIKPADSGTNYTRAYVSALGLVDSARQVFARGADLSPLPSGSLINQDSRVDSYEIHFSDTWRLTPTLTVSYGLTWGVQMPPYEVNGLQTMMVDTRSGQIITAEQLLGARALAASNGGIVNPTIGFVPIKVTGRKYPYDPDYSNFGPRLAAAWNPSFSGGGPLGALFGDRKTVLRGGWGRSFDRLNGVGLVLTPALGAGFGSLSVCTKPGRVGGVACNTGGDPNTSFRIGVDGNHVPIPTLPTISGTPIVIPGFGAPGGPSFVPSNANSNFEARDFRIDPKRKVGSIDTIDFSIQRQLPWNTFLEVGYVGKWSRDLYGNIELNHVPYMFKPKGVNQTFAQAFDAVAAQLQAGVPVTPQPWFEFMLGPGGTLAAANECGFANHGAGLVWAAIEPKFVTGPLTAINTQVKSFGWSMSNTFANYQSGFITLRKRPSHGLSVDFNYTLSHGLDNFGIIQACTAGLTDAYDTNRSYAASLFDRRHTFNLLVNYELPFGKGKHFATGGVADRVFGGWSVSGIYTASTGLPDMVYDSCALFSEFGNSPENGVSVGLIPTKPGVIVMTRVDNPTIGPNGFGSNSASGGPPNMFANPDSVAASFRHMTFADGRTGWGAIRGPLRWNVDLGVAKTTRITERVSVRFDAQFVNAFNHPMFGQGGDTFGFANQPGADIAGPEAFGAPSQQFNSPRFIQVGLRIDF